MGEAIASINKHTGGDAVIVTDVGQHQMIACRYAEFIRSKAMLPREVWVPWALPHQLQLEPRWEHKIVM